MLFFAVFLLIVSFVVFKSNAIDAAPKQYKIIEGFIIRDQSIQEFEAIITKEINDGWDLVGGSFYTLNGKMFQALVK